MKLEMERKEGRKLRLSNALFSFILMILGGVFWFVFWFEDTVGVGCAVVVCEHVCI